MSVTMKNYTAHDVQETKLMLGLPNDLMTDESMGQWALRKQREAERLKNTVVDDQLVHWLSNKPMVVLFFRDSLPPMVLVDTVYTHQTFRMKPWLTSGFDIVSNTVLCRTRDNIYLRDGATGNHKGVMSGNLIDREVEVSTVFCLNRTLLEIVKWAKGQPR